MEDQARATGHVLMACPPKDSCSPCGKRSDPALLFHDADMHEALEFLVSDRCLAEAVTDATFMEPLTDGNFYGSCRAQAEQELTCEKGSMLDPPCVADHTAIRSHFGSLNSDFSLLDDPLHALQSPTGPCLGSDDEGVFPGATGIELLTTDEVDLDGTGMVGLVPQVPPLQVQCAQLPCCADNMLCHGRTGAGVGTAGTLRPSSRTSSTPSSLLSISSVFSGGGSGGAVPHSSHAVGDDHSPHASRNTSCHSSVRTGTGANADASCFEAAADAESGGAGDRGGEGEMPMRTLTRPRRAAALMLSQLANSRNKKRGGAGSTARKLAPNPHGQACTACGATSTPVWRYGPQGPKTLCNACGVRYMKVAKSRR